jgi:hypothetical protein
METQKVGAITRNKNTEAWQSYRKSKTQNPTSTPSAGQQPRSLLQNFELSKQKDTHLLQKLEKATGYLLKPKTQLQHLKHDSSFNPDHDADLSGGGRGAKLSKHSLVVTTSSGTSTTRALVPADKKVFGSTTKHDYTRSDVQTWELQEDETLPNCIKRKHPKEGRRSKLFCKAPGDSNKAKNVSLSLSLSLSTSGILNTTRVCCKKM